MNREQKKSKVRKDDLMNRKQKKTNGGEAADLEPRSIPKQRRSKETVKKILDTTAKLLEEVGIDGFNTNLLAKRTGIRIRTVYRYFPNKFAVITALAERWADMELEWLGDYKDFYDTTLTWREAHNRLLDGYISGCRKQPGAVALRRAMMAVPELRKIKLEANQQMAQKYCGALKKHGLCLPEKHAMVLSIAIITCCAAIWDLALQEGNDYFDELIEENKLFWLNHLATYLD
jgi:AcrR family transcriptional regulator